MEVDVEFCMEVVACSLVFYSPELCWEIQLLGIPPFQINFPEKLVSTVVLAAATTGHSYEQAFHTTVSGRGAVEENK
jgi:hypothetical protein